MWIFKGYTIWGRFEKVVYSWKNDVNIDDRKGLPQVCTDCIAILVFLTWPFFNVITSFGSQLHHGPFFSVCTVVESLFLISSILLLNVGSVQEFLLSPFTVCFPCVITSAARAPALTSFSWALRLIFTSPLPITTWMCCGPLRLSVSRQSSSSCSLFSLCSHLFSYILIHLVILERNSWVFLMLPVSFYSSF